MAQTLDPIPFDDTNTALCCYVNDSSKIQVVRITNISNWYFERVVFPGQRLMFESNIEGQLEIHSGSMASSILEDTVPCIRLRIEQAEDALSDITVNSALELGDDTPSTLKNARQPVHG
ncbi:MAG: DUF1830 domain-containing protein [Cyanobacteria bacterium P01_H01_bin.105]